ncbi:MAG: hypothetical protein IPG17_30630 [Sandaracinaceae bacterium]|nr:hypothetical protein [Sandaracinaceae bacterium]
MITVLVMTDGRLDCLRQSLPSLQTHLHGPVTRWLIHDDTGDKQYHQLLDYHTGPTWELVTTEQRSGFGGAYRHAYDWWLANDTNDYLWSTEDDFVLTRPVDFAAMVQVLAAHDYLTQLALRRQPWNPVEKAAGGSWSPDPTTTQTAATSMDMRGWSIACFTRRTRRWCRAGCWRPTAGPPAPVARECSAGTCSTATPKPEPPTGATERRGSGVSTSAMNGSVVATDGPVWGICMARNEADIIATTVAHMLTQVDRVLVADNLSTDDTAALAERGWC